MSTENLSNKEAIEKIKKLAEDEKMCFFATHLNEHPLSARPMSLQEVDEQGNLWFFSPESSEKNEHIKTDSKVQLLFANKGSNEYLSIYGEATITKDRKRIEELWNAFLNTWFNEGKDDPTITLISVKPLDAYYWDTKNNKLVSLIKIAAGAITGKTMDDGVEGKLKV